MRKFLLAFLLPLILLASQQGAVSHEIGHIADFVARANAGTNGGTGGETSAGTSAVTNGAADGTRGSPHAVGDLQCEACLAFAHLAGVATAQVVPPALLSFGHHFAVIEAPAFIAADAPAARSRGPPTFL